MSLPTLVSEGRCACIMEPRADHGLEGYVLGNTYLYQKMRDAKGDYFRVFPGADNTTVYYETCGPSIFHTYFEEMK